MRYQLREQSHSSGTIQCCVRVLLLFYWNFFMANSSTSWAFLFQMTISIWLSCYRSLFFLLSFFSYFVTSFSTIYPDLILSALMCAFDAKPIYANTIKKLSWSQRHNFINLILIRQFFVHLVFAQKKMTRKERKRKRRNASKLKSLNIASQLVVLL